MDALAKAGNYVAKSYETQVGHSKDSDKTILDAGKGNDDINVHTNIDGSVDVTVNGKEKYSFTAKEAENLEIRGGGGDDKITQSGIALSPFSDPNITLSGGKGNDELHGGLANDNLQGDSGDDTITGSFGDDSIDGGSGNDTISGSFGDDNISGSFGDDDIQGGFGDDTISGSFGNDSISGDSGIDSISGGPDIDSVSYGSSSDSVIYGSIDITQSVDQTDSPDAEYDPVINISGNPNIGSINIEADQSSTGGGTNNASFTPETNISG